MRALVGISSTGLLVSWGCVKKSNINITFSARYRTRTDGVECVVDGPSWCGSVYRSKMFDPCSGIVLLIEVPKGHHIIRRQEGSSSNCNISIPMSGYQSISLWILYNVNTTFQLLSFNNNKNWLVMRR